VLKAILSQLEEVSSYWQAKLFRSLSQAIRKQQDFGQEQDALMVLMVTYTVKPVIVRFPLQVTLPRMMERIVTWLPLTFKSVGFPLLL